jgi:hypothetical protein
MQHSPLVMRRNSARTPGGERKRNVAEGNVPTAKADWEEETVGEAVAVVAEAAAAAVLH